MNFKRYTLVAALAVSSFCYSFGAQANVVNNLVTNGSFEDASIDPGGYTTLNAVSNVLTGWTVSNGSVDYIGTYWQAADGSRSLDMDGNSQGTIASQTLNTIAGQTYLVSFALAGNPDNGPTIKTIQAAIGDSGWQTFTFDTTGKTHSDMGWITESFLYTAVGTSTISFQSLTGAPVGDPRAAWGPALDNVVVTAVPEASTWAMMVLGFLGVGFVAYRRRPSASLRFA
jgi:choice-of-anchor C domain-containing protein